MKLNSLQILRAFAALSVLVTHVFQKTNYKPFGDYFLSGQYGVDVFFILSGFLIYLTVKENTTVIDYAKKRIFRIYPLYIFALLLYVVTGTGKYQMGEGIITYIQNITMMPWSKPIGYNSLVVGVAWSTVFEVFFYFIFFVIISTRLSKRWILVIIPVIFVVSKAIQLSHIIPENTIFLSFLLSLGGSLHLSMFFMGCLISEIFSTDKIPVINKKRYCVLLLVGVVSMFIMMLLRYNFIISFFICSFLFLMLSQFERYYPLNLKNTFVKTFIHWGDISYSIYIFHIMIIKILIGYLNVESTIVLLLFTSVTTIMLSSLTYMWIEKPFIDLSKKKELSLSLKNLIFKQ